MPVFVSLLIHIMDEDLNTIHGKLVPRRLGLLINLFISLMCLFLLHVSHSTML